MGGPKHPEVHWAEGKNPSEYFKAAHSTLIFSFPQLLDSAPYFLKKAVTIGAADYLPTDDDVLRARSQTTGVVTVDFTVGSVLKGFYFDWTCPVKREKQRVET